MSKKFKNGQKVMIGSAQATIISENVTRSGSHYRVLMDGKDRTVAEAAMKAMPSGVAEDQPDLKKGFQPAKQYETQSSELVVDEVELEDELEVKDEDE